MKYKIEVHAEGYEDTCKIVEAPALWIARRSERQARVEWCDHNDIELYNLELPFSRVSEL